MVVLPLPRGRTYSLVIPKECYQCLEDPIRAKFMTRARNPICWPTVRNHISETGAECSTNVENKRRDLYATSILSMLVVKRHETHFEYLHSTTA